tara:strand:- start:38 stop:832 length:795 start_codon:yes stop_codon:yes gene_type:complete
MIVHNFDPVLIDLGIFQIRWYSIAYIFGILLGWAYGRKILARVSNLNNNFNKIKKTDFDDLILYLIVGIIIGGRIGYIIFYNLEYYSENFLEIFKVWRGGMSFHGGLLGVIVAIFLFAKKTNNNFFKFSDIIACVAPIGIFLGRLANFINGELYGKISTAPWAVIFPNVDSMPRHPSQLYEAILEGLVLFIIINYLALKKELIYKTGFISAFFLIVYSFLRMFSELFREPDIQLGLLFNNFSMGTLLSLLTIIIGLFIAKSIKK